MSISTNLMMPAEDKFSSVLIAKGTSLALLGSIVGKGSEYITKIVLGRALGPEDFGVFNLVFGVLFLLGTLSTLDLTAAFIRFTSIYRIDKKYYKIKVLIKNILSFSVAMSIFLCLIVELFSKQVSIIFFQTTVISFYLSLIIIGLPFFSFNQYFFTLLISFNKFKDLIIYRELINKVARLILILALLIIGINLERALFTYLIIFGLISIAGVFFIRSLFKDPVASTPNQNPKEKTIIIREVFKFSWPLSLSAIFVAIMSKLDIFSIGFFLDASNVGLYSAAFTVAFLIQFPTQNFNEMLISGASQMFAKNNLQRLRSIYKANTNWLFYMMFPILVLFFLKTETIIMFSFGEKYLPAAFALKILLIGTLFDLYGTTWSAIIHATGETKIVFPITISNFAILFCLYVFFIPRYGITGGALAYTITKIIVYIPKLAFIWIKYRLTPFSKRLFVFQSIVIVFYICEYLFETNLEFSSLMNLVFGIIGIPIAVFAGIYLSGLSKEDITVIEALEYRFNFNMPIFFKNRINHQH